MRRKLLLYGPSLVVLGAVSLAVTLATAQDVRLNGVPSPPSSGGGMGPVGPTGAVGPTGPAGAVGPTGANGSTGAVGPEGAAGPQGVAGVQGPTGPQGVAGVAGPTGPQGIQGVAGATGLQGIAGPTGTAGGIGPTGLQGIAGPTGPQGATGAQGVTGSTGPAGADATIPSGMIALMLSGTCPAGWTEVVALSGKTLIGTLNASANVGTTGGADTVTPAGTVQQAVFTGSALAAHAHELPFQIPTTTTTRQLAAATFGSGTARAATAVSTAGTANTTSAAVALSQAVTAGTPSGTVNAQTFTGTALDNRSAFVRVIFCSKT